MLFRLGLIGRLLVGWLYTLLFSAGACVGLLVGPVWSWLTFMKPWAKGSLRIMGVRTELVGADNLKGPAVFISNHQSLIDVVFVPAVLPPTTKFVAKKELLWVPLWGWAFSKAGGIMIDRKNPQAAIHSIRDGLKRLPPGWSVVVFPEGTRTRNGDLQTFKKGAFHIAIETGLPIVPIAMEGAFDVVPRHQVLLRPGTIHVTVGAPIDTRGWRTETIAEHMRQAWLAMNDCLAESRRRRDLAMGKAADRRESEVVATTAQGQMG
jgi:1-acyl-sn-glycerol-3-phosphate acyltransferase